MEVKQVMKSQNLRYVASKNQQEKAKIERLKATHHLVGKPAKTEKEQHIVFVDDADEGLGCPTVSLWEKPWNPTFVFVFFFLFSETL